MKITELTQQKKNKDLYSVFIDGSYSFSISLEIMTKYGLSFGREVDEAFLGEVRSAEEKRRGMEQAWRLLDVRSRSRAELTERLSRAKIPPETVTAVLARLEELGYIDDARFARDWIERRRGQGKGTALIRAELRRKGLSSAVIGEALTDTPASGETEKDRALRAAERKLAQLKGLEAPVAARRLLGYLARRGFDPETAADAVRELRKERGESRETDDE